MKIFRKLGIALVLIVGSGFALAGTLRQLGPGSPYWIDDTTGNLYICSASGTHCIPLDTSEPPIEP